jgi:hypothetical protein
MLPDGGWFPAGSHTSIMLGRRGAVEVLDREHAKVLELVRRIPAEARILPGLGGGHWSPKDLLGHLESWEEHALAALEHWERRERPPIETALADEGLDSVNERTLEEKSALPFDTVLRRFRATHRTMVGKIHEMSDERWNGRALPTERRTVGTRLGSILGGPAGPFRHAQAHLEELRAFVRDQAGTRR